MSLINPLTTLSPRPEYAHSLLKTTRLLAWLVVLCPLVLVAIGVSWSHAAAQERTKCWACGAVQCKADPDNTSYRGCTEAKKGGRSCGPLPVPECPAPDTCKLGPGLCPEVMALAAPERNRAIRSFERGGMLPADGAFYVAIQGDQLVLRQKCGAEALARMAARDVGRTLAKVVFAG